MKVIQYAYLQMLDTVLEFATGSQAAWYGDYYFATYFPCLPDLRHRMQRLVAEYRLNGACTDEDPDACRLRQQFREALDHLITETTLVLGRLDQKALLIGATGNAAFATGWQKARQVQYASGFTGLATPGLRFQV